MSDESERVAMRVEFENHTGRMLAFEYEWHDTEELQIFGPADVHPRLVVTVTDMGPPAGRPCRHCGAWPVEATNLDEKEPSYVPGCSCSQGRESG